MAAASAGAETWRFLAAGVTLGLCNGNKRVDFDHRVDVAALRYGFADGLEHGACTTQRVYKALRVGHSTTLKLGRNSSLPNRFQNASLR